MIRTSLVIPMCDPATALTAAASLIASDRQRREMKKGQREAELARQKAENDARDERTKALEEQKRMQRMEAMDPAKSRAKRQAKAEGINALRIRQSSGATSGINIPR